MKRTVSLAALALALTSSAFAADLPHYKAPLPPPPPPPPLWTGFYAGLNAGYDFGTNNNTQGLTTATGSTTIWRDNVFPDHTHPYSYFMPFSHATNQYGFIGGGQVGYNYQWGSSVVVGIEADIQGAGIRGSSTGIGAGAYTGQFVDHGFRTHWRQTDVQGFGGQTVNAGVDWLGTVRGRLGYLFTPLLLVYGTGGLTYGGVYANVNTAGFQTVNNRGCDPSFTYCGSNPAGQAFFGAGNNNNTRTLVGWNAGGGVEWMFMPNWSLKAEAIYWNMGNSTVNSFGGGPGTPIFRTCNDGCSAARSYSAVTAFGTTRVNYQGVIARMGINYHFNWGAPAPVLAKY